MARGRKTATRGAALVEVAQERLKAEMHIVGGGAAQAERVEKAQTQVEIAKELQAILASSDSEVKSVSKMHEGESQGSVKHSATGPVKPAPTVPMAALALDITAAIAKAAEAQVLKALSSLLSQVAADYDLDFEELTEKYLGEAKAKPKRKAPVKAKVTKVEETSDEEGPLKCIALTKKGDRCKCRPRNGEVTCGRHKDYDPEAKVEEKPKKARGRPRKAKAEETSDSEEEVKPKRKPKAKKPVEPEHKHELDAEAEDCEACKEQGPPFQLRSGRSYKAPDEDEIRRRLAALDDSDAETQDDKPEGQAGEGSDFDIEV
jgi:hypothetical protein